MNRVINEYQACSRNERLEAGGYLVDFAHLNLIGQDIIQAIKQSWECLCSSVQYKPCQPADNDWKGCAVVRDMNLFPLLGLIL